jgi:hypothetical protein
MERPKIAVKIAVNSPPNRRQSLARIEIKGIFGA